MQHKLRSEHGGQKPPELCADLIKIFTKEGMNVLDPFMGVGSTAIACKQNNRSYIGFEMSEEYYKAALERLEEL